MWKVGAAFRDITYFEPGTEMLGWAQPTNRAYDVGCPLHARAVVIQDAMHDRVVAFLCAEICMISEGLRHGVIEKLKADHPELGLNQHNLMLSATHTHSGPGGYPHELFYTMTCPGYHPHVYEGIRDGIVEALVAAHNSAREATARWAHGEIPINEPVAFNRSHEAYNQNAGVKKVEFDTRNHATNRTMTLLRFDDRDGVPIASVNWFAVHCTSVHSDNHFLHPDNKGFAARVHEELVKERYDAPEFVSVFAQGAAGDISPNYRWDKKRNKNVGPFDDDFRSARFNGELQAAKAAHLFDQAEALEGELDYGTRFLDFRDYTCSAKHTGGLENRRTGFARIGMPFVEGTAEGPGPLYHLHGINQFLSKLVVLRKQVQALLVGHKRDDVGLNDTHGPKYPFLELGRGGEGLAFGGFLMGKPILPGWFDPTVAEAHRLGGMNALGNRPWVPQRQPIQLIRLGPVAIVGMPSEPTMMAGRRVEQQVRAAMHDAGIEHVHAVGYCNSYAGYCTTWEEYQLQMYEGGSTFFGQWTLAALQTELDVVLDRLSSPQNERPWDLGPLPEPVSEFELQARVHEEVELPDTWFR